MAGDNPADDAVSDVFTDASPDNLTVRSRRRTLTMCSVTETELDTIAALGNSINLAFFGISVGAAVSFGITLKTVPIADPATLATFASFTALSSAGTIYFGIRSAIDYRAAQKKLNDIKKGG